MNPIKHTWTFKIYVVITKSIYQMTRLNFMRESSLLKCMSLLL